MKTNNDVQQYLDVIKRRKNHFVIPGVLVFLLVVVLTFILPPIYKATSTISIEAQEIPQDLVRTTVTGYVEERLQNIAKIVLSRANLEDIIQSFGLYLDLRYDRTTGEIVQLMLESIELEPITTSVYARRSSGPFQTTAAFTLSYEGKNPDQVAHVVNYLSSLFLEENVKDREDKAQATAEFFENQASELRSTILELEQKIAKYKEQHLTELPELMNLNLKTMEELERRIESERGQIQKLSTQKIYLEGQLATLEPTVNKMGIDGRRLLSPQEELELLRSRYLSLSASVSEQHPDVIALKKKLAAMEREFRTGRDLGKLHSQLREKETQLGLMLDEYSEKHPDVISLKKEIDQLRSEIQRLSKEQTVLKFDDQKPNNPTYINLKTRITVLQMEIEAAQKSLKLLRQKYEDYRRRVENAPKVEQKYLDLRRDYDNAREKYQATINRLQAAKEATLLEERREGGRFTIVEPAVEPRKPYKPNRLALLLLGIVLASGSGLGFASVAEYLDQSVYRMDELAKISGHTVLAAVPYLETSQDRRRRLWKRLAFAGSSIVLVAIGLVAVHFFYQPLDIVWVQFMDRIAISF